MEKGTYVETLLAVINACKTRQNITPSAVLLGPREYEEYSLEVAGAMIMGSLLNASKTKVGGVKILITPHPGIDLAFDTELKDKLMATVIENEVKEEYEKREV